MGTSSDSQAYEDGYRDGLAWDLDGFKDNDAVFRHRYGWDTATLNAVGDDDCAKAWGVEDPEDRDALMAAAEDYNRGAYAGAIAPQSRRTGKPPQDQAV